MSEPEQLDLLDWLAAQPLGPPPAPPTCLVVHTTMSPAPVLLTWVDPSCNMRRFYSAALATSLFGKSTAHRRTETGTCQSSVR